METSQLSVSIARPSRRGGALRVTSAPRYAPLRRARCVLPQVAASTNFVDERVVVHRVTHAGFST